MCSVKTPKIDPTSTAPKSPTVIRNRYLDGLGPEQRAMRSGRSAFRIDRGAARRTPSTPTTPLAPPSNPTEGLTGWSTTVPVGGIDGGPYIRRTPQVTA